MERVKSEFRLTCIKYDLCDTINECARIGARVSNTLDSCGVYIYVWAFVCTLTDGEYRNWFCCCTTDDTHSHSIENWIQQKRESELCHAIFHILLICIERRRRRRMKKSRIRAHGSISSNVYLCEWASQRQIQPQEKKKKKKWRKSVLK